MAYVKKLNEHFEFLDTFFFFAVFPYMRVSKNRKITL